jgi:hypothetical protein
VVGGWLGGLGEIEIKAKLSPAEAEVWAELGNLNSIIIFLSIMTPLPAQPAT